MNLPDGDGKLPTRHLLLFVRPRVIVLREIEEDRMPAGDMRRPAAAPGGAGLP